MNGCRGCTAQHLKGCGKVVGWVKYKFMDGSDYIGSLVHVLNEIFIM